MIVEEEFNQIIWWTLQEINKDSLLTLDDLSFYFEFQNSTDENKDVPHINDQRRVIKFLENAGAIKIESREYNSPIINDTTVPLFFKTAKPLRLVLKTIQPKFDSLYTEFKNKKFIYTSNIDNTDPIIYEISFNQKNEIAVNDILLSKPSLTSLNEAAFTYIFEHPNQIIKRADIKTDKPFKKGLDDVIKDLKFRKELKELFFPKCARDAIFFVNPIHKSHLEEKEFSHLKNIKIENIIKNIKKKKT